MSISCVRPVWETLNTSHNYTPGGEACSIVFTPKVGCSCESKRSDCVESAGASCSSNMPTQARSGHEGLRLANSSKVWSPLHSWYWVSETPSLRSHLDICPRVGGCRQRGRRSPRALANSAQWSASRKSLRNIVISLLLHGIRVPHTSRTG